MAEPARPRPQPPDGLNGPVFILQKAPEEGHHRRHVALLATASRIDRGCRYARPDEHPQGLLEVVGSVDLPVDVKEVKLLVEGKEPPDE